MYFSIKYNSFNGGLLSNKRKVWYFIMNNIPVVKLGIIAVSRDCFPITLSQSRCQAIVNECGKIGVDVFSAPTCVENEKDRML